MKKTIFRLALTMALTILIALTSATSALMLSAPLKINNLPQFNYVSNMLKEEDIFGGRFSQQNLKLVAYEPTEASFSITPTMDVPDVEVRFIFPGDLVRGSIVRAQGQVHGGYVWTGDVKKGETVTLVLSVVAEEGIEAYVRAYVRGSPSGKAYRSSYYLGVSTLTEPQITEGNAGSLRQVSLPENAITTSNVEPTRTLEDTQVSSDPQSPGVRIKGRMLYWNEDGGTSPARWMLVWVRDDSGGGWLAYQWTDGEGDYDISFAWSSGLDPYVQLWAEGAWDWITTTSGGDKYGWNSAVCGYNVPDGFTYDYGNLAPSSSNEALQAGDAVFAEAQWIYNSVSWSRPTKVTIRWPREDWPHCHGDYIDLPDKSTASWDHVIVQHEYGHSVMWTLYGNSWPEGFVGGSHWVYMEDVLPDAWVEGWAEFMQCAVDNNPNNLQSAGHNIETNDWYNHQDTGDMDGEYVEGEVASILWDILDPTSAADRDYLSWGFDEIFTVVRYGDAGVDDNPNSILDFWIDWITRWFDLATSRGPLCTIYWHYGIDKDVYAPHEGSISINAGATYTTSTSVTLTLSASDWGSGVADMRFSNVYPHVWSSWYTYATSKSWTLSTGDGTKTVYVQYRDGKGYTSIVWSDTIILDTVAPVTTITHAPGSSTVSLSATDPTPSSGLDYTKYRIDGGSWITYTAPFTLTGTGTHIIDYYSKDKAGNTETTKSLTVHYLTVNTDPAGLVTISGTGWYNAGTTAATGTAPSTVTSGGIVYTFKTWKKDGTAVSGNPISVLMDAPHTATATYQKTSIAIDTDKTTYRAGSTMNVTLGVKNPGAALPVRLIIALMLPDSSIIIFYDATLTLPAGLDVSFTLLYFTMPTIPAGNYYWLAFLFDPTTMNVISWDYAPWTFEAPSAPTIAAIPASPAKIPKIL